MVVDSSSAFIRSQCYARITRDSKTMAPSASISSIFTVGRAASIMQVNHLNPIASIASVQSYILRKR
jgi:hypothetical protein